MYTRKTAIICFGFVFILSGDVFLWSQDREEPEPTEYVQDLERRIQILEQTVKLLQEQLQTNTSGREDASGSEPSQAAGAPVQLLAQDSSADPPVDISGYAFGDYYWMAANHDSDLEDRNGFRFRRIYLTFDKSLSDAFDARLRLEMRSPGDFTSTTRLDPFVKNAYLRWKLSNRHQAHLGLSPTPTLNVVDEFWGYRWVEKSLLDLQKMATSADMGLALRGSLDSGEQLRYHFMVSNGSGTRGESDQGKKVLLSLGLYPSDSVILELYSDYESRPLNTNRRTFQSFLAYQAQWGRLGFQYVHQTRSGTPDLQLDALSLFGVAKLSPATSLFWRYDRMFDPNPDGAGISYIPFHPGAKSNFFLTGVDLKVHERFSLLPNVEVVRYDKLQDGTRPKSDLIPRVTFFYRF
ncbi:MAG: porin [Acidobacteria bacterium]|nr:porin [Acidobacteriota bacterium]MCZ6879324.1 porin [Acidobacteriota bacterium]